jgi:AAA+ superfamily predicted ATPase
VTAGDVVAGRAALPPIWDHLERVYALRPEAVVLVRELLDAALGRGSAARPMREWLAPRLADRPAETLAAIDPSGGLVRHRLVAVRGEGPWLERIMTLADDFWPRLVEHWPVGVPRARAPRPDALATLDLDEATRRAAVAARSAKLVLVRGRAGSGRSTLARAIADSHARAVLELDAATLEHDPVLVVREARWQTATVVCDELNTVSPRRLAGLRAEGVRVIGTWPAHEPAPAEATVVELPAPGFAERLRAWRRGLAARSLAAPADLEALVARYRLGRGAIAQTIEAVATLGAAAQSDALHALCRDVGARCPWVRRVPATDHLDELIVTPAVQRELTLIEAWGRQRTDERAPGLTCLFYGPSGTGKSLAAMHLARRLGLELFRVDLSQVIDKYVGETEKRLEQVFVAAEASGATLLFDEADALFGRRAEVKDAHDRYANLETSYLLQRLEAHHGLVLLTSNSPQSIDAAFFRRFGFAVDFGRPGRDERRRLWALHTARVAAAEVDVSFLANRFELAGGDIVNACFAATLVAAAAGEPVHMRHVVIAGWRELIKSGRLVDGRDLEPWWSAVETYLGLRPAP